MAPITTSPPTKKRPGTPIYYQRKAQTGSIGAGAGHVVAGRTMRPRLDARQRELSPQQHNWYNGLPAATLRSCAGMRTVRQQQGNCLESAARQEASGKQPGRSESAHLSSYRPNAGCRGPHRCHPSASSRRRPWRHIRAARFRIPHPKGRREDTLPPDDCSVDILRFARHADCGDLLAWSWDRQSLC